MGELEQFTVIIGTTVAIIAAILVYYLQNMNTTRDTNTHKKANLAAKPKKRRRKRKQKWTNRYKTAALTTSNLSNSTPDISSTVPAKNLCFIRHGQCLHNVEPSQRWSIQDPELTLEGQRQVQE